jgi:hypothetical protein
VDLGQAVVDGDGSPSGLVVMSQKVSASAGGWSGGVKLARS